MSRRRALPSVLAAAALFPVCGAGLPACKTAGGQKVTPDAAMPAATGPAVIIETPERKLTFRVEVARSLEERERGLMYRERLAPGAGMLFLFDSPSVLTFWMKNTFIPLDMIFIDGSRRVVGVVANAEPRTLTARRVDEPSQYVLEIGGGLAAQLGIRAGARVELRDIPVP